MEIKHFHHRLTLAQAPRMSHEEILEYVHQIQEATGASMLDAFISIYEHLGKETLNAIVENRVESWNNRQNLSDSIGFEIGCAYFLVFGLVYLVLEPIPPDGNVFQLFLLALIAISTLVTTLLVREVGKHERRYLDAVNHIQRAQERCKISL